MIYPKDVTKAEKYTPMGGSILAEEDSYDIRGTNGSHR